MKISQRLIVIVLIGIFIIGLVVLYMNYSKQVSARTLAQQNLTAANADLTKSTTDKNTAQKQLDQANSEITQLQNQVTQAQQNLANKKTAVPTSADSVDYDEILFNAAVPFNVSVLSITTDKPAESKLDNITFDTASFNVALKGNMADVLNYLYALATDTPFQYATINSLSMNTVNETQTTTAADGTQTETTVTYETMNVQITMYTYGGQ